MKMEPVSDGNRISISRKLSPDQREVGSGKKEVESRSEGSVQKIRSCIQFYIFTVNFVQIIL